MEDIILNKLKTVNSPRDAERIINETFPNWLVCDFEGYSQDYPHLQSNWNIICQRLNTSPKRIVLVDDITFDETPSLKNKLCEFMTSYGYCVRRKDEFVPCRVCEKAIPCIEIYTLLKEKNFNVPDTWDNKCKDC